MNKTSYEQAFMAEALQLATKGLYTTRTNPRVGCVIVKDNTIIGRGYHVTTGGPHAEVVALESCNSAGNSAEGATVYVNLEPCSHTGKTPPCVEALIAAKVSRVVAAILDPNPLVQGKGISQLQDHGIETKTNILANEAAELNKGFIKRMQNNQPYVTVKSAISLDGKTALSSGESKWISCEASRNDVQKLRARNCAIMTGINTVIADDPNLTVRMTSSELDVRGNISQPKRVILDTNLRVSLDAKVLQNGDEVIIYTCADENDKSIALKKNMNVEVVQTVKTNNHVDLEFVMNDLAQRGFNEVLIEAGTTLVGSVLENQLVDEMVVYMAPHMMGNASRGIADLNFIQKMQDRIKFDFSQVRKIGSDLRLELKPDYS